MKIRVATYNIRPDPTTNGWLDNFDGDYWTWTARKAQAWRFSGKEVEDRLIKVRRQYPNALLEAASKRVDWAKPKIESGFDRGNPQGSRGELQEEARKAANQALCSSP